MLKLGWSSVIFLAIVSGSTLYGDDWQWDQYIQGFRKEHHFGLTAATGKRNWRVRKLGTLESKRLSTDVSQYKLSYSFFIPIYRRLGYVLGSSAGYSESAGTEADGFRAESAWYLPSFILGLAVDVGQRLRVSAGVDVGIERFSAIEGDFSEREGDDEVSLSMMTVASSVSFDFFYHLQWAAKAEYSVSNSWHNRPKDVDSDPLINAAIFKAERWLGLGIVYHLL